VAVLINKAMIEIPPKFAGMPPVNPESRSKKELIKREWKGAEGLAEDVRYYGQWMRDEAEKRIGHLYPKVLITPEMVNDPENPRPDLKLYEGQELTVIAWLWARTVKSPNPAFSQVEVPLASTFILSTKANKEAYVQPVIDGDKYRFVVNVGTPKDAGALKYGTRGGKAQDFLCLLSGVSIPRSYVRDEGKAGRIGSRLMAIVASGRQSRVYLSPNHFEEETARSAANISAVEESRKSFLSISTPTRAMITGGVCSAYGLTTYGDLFTDRQLVALNTFSDLVSEAQEQIKQDALKSGLGDDGIPLRDGGIAAKGYADAISSYLGVGISKIADSGNALVSWKSSMDQPIHLFTRQAIPMVWDFAEPNPLGGAMGDPVVTLNNIARVLDKFQSSVGAFAGQLSAQDQSMSDGRVVSTDPPYYNNIGYADLSDFFYVWLRRSLKPVFPGLFSTLAVPKAEELVATPYRHGSKDKAEQFFLDGMTQAMDRLAVQSHPGFPLTIYYAFKQSETKGSSGAASTGWETFLAAVMEAGLAIMGTWPIRTELANRMIGSGANALASSVVLVCQRRDPSAAILSRNDFRRELRQRLPQAIKELEHANIAPVDVAQAAIGPGMAIFSQAKAVLNPDDSTMSVRDALIEINAALDEHLSEDEGSFDADTRFALTFFESHGYSERPFGDAEGLAVARNISVQGVASAGILNAIAGKVQLLRREQLDDDWDPSRDDRLCVWEATQHLIKALEAGGEAAAAALMVQLKQLPGQSDLLANCRALAYRLYNHCEKTKQAEEGRAYNGLVIAWQEIERQASNQPTESTVQASLI
jgi:putative DNA methylase